MTRSKPISAYLVSTLLLFSGSSWAHHTKKMPTQSMSETGSLYHQGSSISLYGDSTKRHVGDVITVMLDERLLGETKASVKSSDDTKKSVDKVKTGTGADRKKAVKHSHNIRGGVITVAVVKVLANGNLKIQGDNWLKMGGETKHIHLTGIIRPEDLLENNTISSSKIANVQFSYGR